MSNHEIIGQALTIMREPLSIYVLQQLQSIPEYRIDDAWWQQGVLPFIRDNRDYDQLSSLSDYAERQDALDVSMCLNLMISHWNNLFKYRLPISARSWVSEIRDARNAWAHFKGGDSSDKETKRALDTMALLLGEIDAEAQEEIQQLYRTIEYGSGQRKAITAIYEAFGYDTFSSEMFVATLNYSVSYTYASLHKLTLLRILEQKITDEGCQYQLLVNPEDHPECFIEAA